MALADITKKIISEAEVEAERILQQGNVIQQQKLKSAKAELDQERKQHQESCVEFRARTLEQKKQLLTMEAGQKILSAKRNALGKILNEVEQDILQDKDHYKLYLENTFQQIKPLLLGEAELVVNTAPFHAEIVEKAAGYLGVKSKVHAQKNWQQGRLEVVLKRSSIDCSLKRYIAERGALMAREIAAELFT